MFERQVTAQPADIDELGHVNNDKEVAKPRVRAKTSWAILDRRTGRPLRVPSDVAEPSVS